MPDGVAAVANVGSRAHQTAFFAAPICISQFSKEDDAQVPVPDAVGCGHIGTEADAEPIAGLTKRILFLLETIM